MNSYTKAESELSTKSRSFLHRVKDQVRKRQNQSSNDATKDSDKNSLCLRHWKHLYSCERITWKIYIPSKIQKISQWNRCSTCLRNWCLNNPMRSMEWKQLTGKTLHGSICLCLVMKKSSISSTQRSTYSQDSVLCLGKVNENPQSNIAWEDRLKWYKTRMQNFRQNWWWANGIGVEYFPRIRHIAALPQSPRVIVKIERNTSEIYWTDYRCTMTSHGDLRKKNASQVLNSSISMRRDFQQDFGHSLVLDLRIKKKKVVFYQSEDSPQGEWDKIAELMMFKFGESGHPIFRPTSPVSRGVLKSKGGGKLSIHYCADHETIETVFRTVVSVNQLSLYGAVAEMCEEYETFHDRTGRPVVGGLSDSSFVPSVLKTKTYFWMMILHKKHIYCKNIENELKSYHNKTDWANFVLMQDSWLQLKSDSVLWRKTLHNFHNSQMQWLVVSTLCQETKIHLNLKVGS